MRIDRQMNSGMPSRLLSRSHFVLIYSLILCTVLVAPLSAFDETISGGVVLVAAGSPSEGSDTVRRVVLSSIVLHLEQQGLVSLESDEREIDSGPSARVLTEGEDLGADFALQAATSVGEGEVTIDLSLYLIEGGELLATERSVEQIGLNLDRAIAGVAGNVLAQARPFLEAAAEERRREAAPAPARAGVFGDGTDLVRAPAGSTPPATAPPVSIPPVTAPPSVPGRVVSTTALFAPFVPIEAASSYFDISYGGTLHLTVLPFARDYLGFGITARGVLTQATGLATSAQAILVPLGLSAYASSLPTPFATFIRVIGGGAYFRLTNDQLGTFTELIPYAAAELGFRVAFGTFGLVSSVAFEAYFEGSVLLLGFVPGIGISLAL